MAGPASHLLVIELAIASPAVPEALRTFLAGRRTLVRLAGVGPDLPAMHDATHLGVDWADRFHTVATDAPVRALLRGLPACHAEVEGAVRAWLYGYVAHVVTDAVVHPIVQRLVRGSDGARFTHECAEITQDCLAWKDVLGREVVETGLADLLKPADDAPGFDGLLRAWEAAVRAAYPGETVPESSALAWFRSYTALLDVADGMQDQGLKTLKAPAVRHAVPVRGQKIGDRYFYHATDDIRAEGDQRAHHCYDACGLPSGGYGSFLEHGIRRSVGHVVEAWNRLEAAMGAGTGDLDGVIGPWNLDHGTDADGRIVFWQDAASPCRPARPSTP